VRYLKAITLSLLVASTHASAAGIFAQEQKGERARLTAQADYFLSKRQPERAYELLKPLELLYAGDMQYNYLLGLAAIDMGQAEEATWVLERVIAVAPHHAGARMAMARAFFQLKNFEKAKREFELLAELEPPETAKKVIALHLAKIDQIVNKKAEWRLSGNLYSSLGYDSNANSAPTDNIIIPGPSLRNFLIAFSQGTSDGSLPTDAEKSSAYYEVGSANRLEYALPDTWSFWGRYQAETKQLVDQTDLSTIGLDLALGARWRKGEHNVTTELAFNNSWRDGSHNKDVISLQSSYSQAMSARLLLGGYLVLEDQSFPESTANNAFVGTLGLTSSYIIGQYRPVILQLGLFGSSDQAKNNRADGDKTMFGGRLGASYIYNQKHSFSADITVTDSEYEQENASFEKMRSETQVNLGVGYQWKIDSNLSLKAQLMKNNVDSSISLYESEKTEAFIRVNYGY
jgi:tetratricopeptide (TPR) repeat protein